MSVLVVLAHPLQDSFVHTVFERVTSVLAQAGCDHAIIDLYQDGYVPPAALPDAHLDALDAARTLVLIHPTWWTTQPAVLSGWLTQASRTDLTRIERLVCFVTHGGSRWSNWLGGEAGRQFISNRFRRLCAPGARIHWVGCYGLDRARTADRVRFLDHAGSMARRLLVPLPEVQLPSATLKQCSKERLR